MCYGPEFISKALARWVEDGTRMFGTDEARRRFFDLSKRELERRGLPWALVGGQGSHRFLNVLRAIDRATRRTA